jgi:trehalose 6-phosphate phosphatase
VDDRAERLRPLTDDPARAAILTDVDGTLAPIVDRPELSRVPVGVVAALDALVRRYRCVACVSGRPALDARRLVGLPDITYVGLHGAELLPPGTDTVRVLPAVEGWAGPIQQFSATHDTSELRDLQVRIGDKGPIAVFHWRGVPDEDAALAHLEGVARDAELAGFGTHWGRKVLEIRPPTPIGKGLPVRHLVAATRVRVALYAGDDVTDLDAFDALDALVMNGDLDAALRVGVRSDEGPPDIVSRADLVVDGVSGFAALLDLL